jgi:hypothetical protein
MQSFPCRGDAAKSFLARRRKEGANPPTEALEMAGEELAQALRARIAEHLPGRPLLLDPALVKEHGAARDPGATSFLSLSFPLIISIT